MLELLMGGGGVPASGKAVAQTAPDRSQTMAMNGWFNLAMAAEKRWKGLFSGRVKAGWEIGNFEQTGGNIYAGSMSYIGHRWKLACGLSRELWRGQRSQFAASATASGILGMDANVEYWLTPYFGIPSGPPVIEHYHFHYRPSVGPHVEIAWHYHGMHKPLGFVLRGGAEYFHVNSSRVELPGGRDALPPGLAPFLGPFSGWGYTLALGMFGWGW